MAPKKEAEDVTIVKVNVLGADGDTSVFLRHICKRLFKQWSEHYKKRYRLQDVDSLISFYKSHPEFTLYAAVDNDGKFKGCYSSVHKDGKYWLGDMYVVPEDRNRGIGSMLLSHAINNRNDGEYVYLYSEEHTISYYKKHGFKIDNKLTAKEIDGKTFEFYSMSYLQEDFEDTKYPFNTISILAIIGLIMLWIVWKM